MKFYVTHDDDQTWYPASDGLYYPGDSAVHVGENFRLGLLNQGDGRTAEQLRAERGAESVTPDLQTRLRYAQRMLTAVGTPDRMAAAVASTMTRMFADGKNAALTLLLDEVDQHIVTTVGAP